MRATSTVRGAAMSPSRRRTRTVAGSIGAICPTCAETPAHRMVTAIEALQCGDTRNETTIERIEFSFLPGIVPTWNLTTEELWKHLYLLNKNFV